MVHTYDLYCRIKKECQQREFLGGPVLRTWRSHCCGLGSIPGQGTKIPQACSQKKREEERVPTERLERGVRSIISPHSPLLGAKPSNAEKPILSSRLYLQIYLLIKTRARILSISPRTFLKSQLPPDVFPGGAAHGTRNDRYGSSKQHHVHPGDAAPVPELPHVPDFPSTQTRG